MPFSRRAFIAGSAALAALSPLRAVALSEGEARALIDSAVSEINAAINNGRSESALFADFERIFRRYSDVPTIARSVLGPPARSASSAELAAFTEAFTGYVSRKYGRRFQEFRGSDIKVNGTRAVKSFYEVQATVILRGQSPFAVSFMVSDRSGRDLFFDLLIEGISLLKAERSEIGALYDQNGRDVGRLTRALGSLG